MGWAMAAAMISGVAVFANSLAVRGIDPIVHTTIKNAFVGLLVVGLVMLSRERKVVGKLNRGQWLKLVGIAVIGGSLAFALFFTGLKQIGATEGQMLNKTLVVWVALLAVPFLKEKLTVKMAAGIVLIYASSLIGGGWKSTEMMMGHGFVLAATGLWAVETILVKKTLTDVPVNIAVGARMGLGSLILWGWLIVTDKVPLVAKLSWTQWGLLLMVGLILFGYVMSWYRALKDAPATVVSSILVGAVVITTLLEAVFGTKSLTGTAVIQAGMILTGIYLAATACIDLKALGERATTFWKPKIS